MVSLPQMHEIVNTYKPNVVWSDGDWEAPDTYWNSTQFLAWLYNESPVKDEVVVNDRWGRGIMCHHGDFYTCHDKYDPGKLQPHKWENCMTLDQSSWGHRRTMTAGDVLPVTKLIEKLARTVSCGGNLLLNAGPTSYGMIPPIFEERLGELGKWLEVNGDSVYSTKPWIHQNDTITPNVWFTSKIPGEAPARKLFNRQTKNTVVYAWMLDWPKDGLLRLGATVPTNDTKVTLLGYASPINVKLYTLGIKIDLTTIPYSQIPSIYAWVFKIENLKEDLLAEPKIGALMDVDDKNKNVNFDMVEPK